MKHLVRICLTALALLCAVPAVHADELCDAAIAEGQQKYNEGDYQTAKELFEFAKSECGDDYKGVQVQTLIDKCDKALMPTTLSVSKTSLQFGANGETKTITVTCNRAWSLANTSSSMFTVSRNGNKITVNCKANTSTSGRNDWFDVKSADGTQSQRIKITQSGRQAASSGSQSNTSSTKASTPTQSTSSGRSTNSSSSYSPNQGVSFTIVGDDGGNYNSSYSNSNSDTYGYYPTFYVLETVYTIPASGGYYGIDIYGDGSVYINKAWTNKNWLEEENIENGGRCFHVKSNPSHYSRYGQLYITDSWGRKITIHVNQKGK